MYKFTKDCMTGIESIDKEHEQLFKIINEAGIIRGTGC